MSEHQEEAFTTKITGDTICDAFVKINAIPIRQCWATKTETGEDCCCILTALVCAKTGQKPSEFAKQDNNRVDTAAKILGISRNEAFILMEEWDDSSAFYEPEESIARIRHAAIDAKMRLNPQAPSEHPMKKSGN